MPVIGGINWSDHMSAVANCAERLRNAILAGEVGSGLRLPPERTLAEQLGVNRVTVRGALARLESEGLVDVRQGSGYTVKPWRRSGGPELVEALVGLARDANERRAIFEDLLLVRRQIARAVLERLAERGVAEDDVVAIERAIERLDAAAQRGAPAAEIAAADLAVAGAVVDATKSSVLALCMNPVASLLVELPLLQRAMFREPDTNVLAWRALVAWIRGGCSRAGLARITEALAERDERTKKALER